MSMTPWTDASKALVGALFGDPDTQKAVADRDLVDAKTREALSGADYNSERTREISMRNDALGNVNPELFDFNRPQPGYEGDDLEDYNRRVLESTMFRVAQDPSKLGDTNLYALSRAFGDNPSAPGVEESLRVASAGAGILPTKNTAITPGESDRMATRDTDNAIRQEWASPRSTDEIFAMSLQNLPGNELSNIAKYNSLPAALATPYAVSDNSGGDIDLAQAIMGLQDSQTIRNTPGGGFEMITGPQGFAAPTTSVEGGVQDDVRSSISTLNNLDAAIERLQQENRAIESGEASIPTGSTMGTIISPGPIGDDTMIGGLSNLFSLGRAFPITRELIEGAGVTQEEVKRIRGNRTEIVNAARQTERRIANGSQTGQFTREDAQSAANTLKLIELGGSNDEILSQLLVLKNLENRSLDTNTQFLREGIPMDNPFGQNDSADPFATNDPGLPQIQGDQDYELLAPGTRYLDPNGVERVKR